MWRYNNKLMNSNCNLMEKCISIWDHKGNNVWDYVVRCMMNEGGAREEYLLNCDIENTTGKT